MWAGSSQRVDWSSSKASGWPRWSVHIAMYTAMLMATSPWLTTVGRASGRSVPIGISTGSSYRVDRPPRDTEGIAGSGGRFYTSAPRGGRDKETRAADPRAGTPPHSGVRMTTFAKGLEGVVAAE